MPTDPPTAPSEHDLDYGPTLRGLREGMRVFQRYTLKRKLGQGGMGMVWLAHDERLDLEVALKFLLENLAHDETALDDLRRETRRCMKLNHPHIVRVYDLVEGGENETAAIAMEYVEGKSLTGLRMEKPSRVFEEADIAPWMRQVCEALEYAHTEGKVVHRDLKPANLMVDGRGKLRVMDFGIASSLGDSMSRLSKASQAHSGSGTLPYMSPQQIMGHAPSVSDDVYSLGATIYELLTSRPPFFRGGNAGISRQIETQVPPSMAERRKVDLALEGTAGLSSAWEQTVAACLDKDPLKRPQNAAEVWERLTSTAATPAQGRMQEKETQGEAANHGKRHFSSSSSNASIRKYLIPSGLLFAIASLGMFLWPVLKPGGGRKAETAAIATSLTPDPSLHESGAISPVEAPPGLTLPPARGEIVVGEFASLTGKEAAFGISSHEGTLLAVEELNAAGGVLGRFIELKTEDDRSEAGGPASVVNKLISKDGAIAVLGEVASSRSLEAAPVCQQNRIPMISPAASSPNVTEAGEYIFRVCFIDPFQGTVMANFATKTLKAKKVAMFTDVKSDYSKGLAKFFKEGFTNAGGKIVSELEFNGGDKDFKGQLTAIMTTAPDAVFIPGYYTDVALICIQAKQLGLNVPLLGGDGWESDLLMKIGGDAVEGHYFSTHYASDSNSPRVVAFVDAYQKRYGGKVPNAMAALGYESAMLLADGIRRAVSTEGPRLRDALAVTQEFETLTGKITLNERRDAVKSAVIMTIKNGRFVYVETIAP